MAYFLFIDESGINESAPYEVFGGFAVEDRDIWNLIIEVHDLEEQYFGRRYSLGKKEIKGSRLLDKITFRQAGSLPPISKPERVSLARYCIENGANSGIKEIAALAQAKLDFVFEILEMLSRFRCKIFASMSNNIGVTEIVDHKLLPRNYVFLLERFYYFLEDKSENSMGILVFDEFEKSSSHILIEQIESYFKNTTKGRQRSSLVIPEPFFVHSDLTTGIQLADIIVYLINWGFRLKNMDANGFRHELSKYIELIKLLRDRREKEINDIPDMEVWSIFEVK